MRLLTPICIAAAALPLALVGEARADVGKIRIFNDRPVAWHEHDDESLAGTPEKNQLQKLEVTLALRDGLSSEIDRIMSLESASAALDVNAADEVPCSTWFCARNHLGPIPPDALVAATTSARPRPPLTVIEGKDQGAAPGFEVRDARGDRFLVKLDPPGHLGMTTGAEVVGNAVFHAAGYNVPGASLVAIDETTLKIDPRATYKLYGVQPRPLTEALVRKHLKHAARLPDGRVRGVAIPWLPGTALGSFDMAGTRPGDPNDRIAHQQRRSLRASRVMFTWLSILDPGSINTLDTLVESSGRRYVRHNFIDFSCTFGSATNHAQGLHQEGEHVIEIGRTLAALFSFGIYQRPFQQHRAEYERMVGNYSAIGYYPAETFDPDHYRQDRKNPAFTRLTERDAYWGAKIVTSFTDAQIGAVVAAAQLPQPDAAAAAHGLRVRRDILGRRYLRPMAAVEAPAVNAAGSAVCFDDLAIARGYLRPADARYEIEARDVTAAGAYASGPARHEQAAGGSRACVPLGQAGPGTGYRVLQVRTRLGDGQLTKASRIHLRWRAGQRRFVVVGLERDE